NRRVDRILIGMHDAYTGLDVESLKVTLDFQLGTARPGENLAGQFKNISAGVWELKLPQPLQKMKTAQLQISVKDRQGNTSEIKRTFSVE
ncbi:MAG: hypothetical protein ACI9HK_002239, partial [Pirellulaceae bacterium]